VRSDGADGQGQTAHEQGRALSNTVVAIGLALTALIAVLQQSNATTERRLMFDAASARLQQGVVDQVDLEISEFESGNNFIAATHPGPIEEYKAFFVNEVELLSEDDPGVIFLELANSNEIDQLIEREHNLGNPDFAVTLFPGTTSERSVLTRLAREVRIFGVPLLGLDVTTLRNQLLPPVLDGSEFEMFIVSADDLASFISPTRQQNVTVYGDYVQFLVGSVTDPSGEFLGYSIRFQPVATLYDSFNGDEWDNLNMEIFVDDFVDPIGGRVGEDSPARTDAELLSSREVTTTSLNWRIDVWADEDFGDSSGIFFGQIWVWVAGIVLTAVGYAATLRRRRHQQRLNTAQFELAHARTLAQTDALTGLLNRNGLIDAARQVPLEQPATVFFIDLDGFKSVNDSDGHEHGDHVLRAVAVELRSIFRSKDLVARLGGDEFVVFTEHGEDTSYVDSASTRITEAVSCIDSRVTCSLGIASRTSEQRTDVKGLMRAADAAMYTAKRDGGDRFAVHKHR
jgi:diguanylate cyclase (GGDEF)-like protein